MAELQEAASTPAAAAPAAPAAAATPGKSSLTAQAVDDDALPALMAARHGEQVDDGSGFSYVVLDNGAFEITKAPTKHTRSLHQVIAPFGRYAAPWRTLARKVAGVAAPATPTAPAPKTDIDVWTGGTTPPAAEDKPKQDAAAPAAGAAPKEDGSAKEAANPANPGAAADEEAGGSGAEQPALEGDIRWCVRADARVRDAAGKELVPRSLVPLRAYVRVLETNAQKRVRVAVLSSVTDPAGSEVGWVTEANLKPLVRAPRPSSPGAQMAALLAAATTTSKPAGLCYRAIKAAIFAAGGYGDILDIQNDERFEGLLGSAVNFATAVEKHGAQALGLETVGGLPADAAPGTLLVTRGNGKIKISEEHGDIAVIAGVQGGCVVAYNDGMMRLIAKPEKWATDYKGVLVGMYRPITRK